MFILFGKTCKHNRLKTPCVLSATMIRLNLNVILLAFNFLVTIFAGSAETTRESKTLNSDTSKQSKAVSPSRAKAAIVILCRNSDLRGLDRSLSQLEHHFNKKYNYPYVFLNNAEFSDTFKNGIKKLTASKVEFGLIWKSIGAFQAG